MHFSGKGTWYIKVSLLWGQSTGMFVSFWQLLGRRRWQDEEEEEEVEEEDEEEEEEEKEEEEEEEKKNS